MLEPHKDRFTWDAPIHSIADIEALPYPPRMVNVKPSRFGGVQALMDAYDYLAERGIGAYGGGQFELGPGRGHIQYLASLFHPDTPNDVAPGGYNLADPPAGPAGQPARAAPEQDRLSLGGVSVRLLGCAAVALQPGDCSCGGGRARSPRRCVRERARPAQGLELGDDTACGAAEVPGCPERDAAISIIPTISRPTTGRVCVAA